MMESYSRPGFYCSLPVVDSCEEGERERTVTARGAPPHHGSTLEAAEERGGRGPVVAGLLELEAEAEREEQREEEQPADDSREEG
jgi:hypothetical protein